MRRRTKRAGQFARTKARIERDQFFRSLFHLFAVSWILYAITTTLAIVMMPSWLRPYLIGAAIIGLGWFTHMLLAMDGTHSMRWGAEAEGWTSRELRRLGRDWQVADHLEFDDRDIDHVLVGPGGVFAIETKFSRLTGKHIAREVITRGIDDAARAARRLRLFLRSKGLDHAVQPVLVVWGRAAIEAARRTREHTKVLVLDGGTTQDWPARLATNTQLDADSVRAIDAAVWKYIETYRPYEERAGLSLRIGRRARNA